MDPARVQSLSLQGSPKVAVGTVSGHQTANAAHGTRPPFPPDPAGVISNHARSFLSPAITTGNAVLGSFLGRVFRQTRKRRLEKMRSNNQKGM